MPETVLKVLLIAAYLAMLLRHALAGRDQTTTVEGYLVAGRNLGGVVVALSFYATFMSTNTFIGAAGRSWDVGLAWCVGGVVLTALATISWVLVAPRFVPLTRQYASLTVADFLGSHYRSAVVRRVAALIVALASILYLIAIYRGAALAIEMFLGLAYPWCVLATAFIVTGYTLVGGFKSVVKTDAVQGVLMSVGAVLLFAATLHAGGGLERIGSRLREIDPSLASWSNGEGLAAALAYSIAVGVKYLVEPRQLSRFYGLRDQRALRTARWLAPLIILVSYACLLPLGAMARTMFDAGAVSSTDEIVPFLLGPADVLGPILGAFFLLVLISAAMSSIDSVLLVTGATISRDLIRLVDPMQPDPDGPAEVRRTRVFIIGVSALAALSSLIPAAQDIIAMTKFSGSLYGACFLPALVVGLFVKRREARVALAAMAVGAVCVVAFFVFRQLGLTSIQEVYPGIGLALFVYVIGVALSARRPSVA